MKKFGIVVSKFNEDLTDQMLEACMRGFNEQGVEPIIKSVPGAAEIPFAAQRMIMDDNVDAVVALGVVIRGDTLHFDMVCRMCADGIQFVSLKHNVPIIFEVLMTNSYADAELRIEKAYDASFSATQMVQ